MVQCPACGCQHKEGALFCSQCGTKLNNPAGQSPAGGQGPAGGYAPRGGYVPKGGYGPASGYAPKGGYGPAGYGPTGGYGSGNQKPGVFLTEEEKARRKKRKFIIALVSGLIIVGIIATLVAISMMKPRVKLNNYISFTVEGYNTVGMTQTELYTDKLCNDFSRSGVDIYQMIEDCIKWEVENEGNLKNGDVATLKWKCNDKKAKEKYGLVLKYSDIKLKVENLEEVETFDAFDGVVVEFNGMDGHGSPTYTYKAKENDDVTSMDLSYNFDKWDGLSNGDVVKLWIENTEDGNVDWFVEEFGVIPSPLYKEYTVSGLGKYVTKSSELSDTAIKKLREKAEEYYNYHLTEEFSSNGESFKGIDYLGYYLLKAKDDEYTSPINKLYLVYKAHVLNMADSDRKNSDIYWYMCFEDLSVNEAGDVNEDFENYSTPSDSFSISLGSGWNSSTWYYYGYETLDLLYSAVISDQSDEYTYEENVNDDGQATSDSSTTASDQPTDTDSEEGIIFPDSSTRYLTQSEVKALTNEQIRAAINELHARNGYIFKDKTLGDFYKKYSWYHPTINYDQFDMSQFNEIETANVELLQKERESRQ